MKTFLSAFIILLLTAAPVLAAEVKNTVVSQQGSRLVFTYDLDGKADEVSDITLTLTINGRQYNMKDLHLEGDIVKVKTGKGKRIYWNALQDFPRGISADYQWKLTASGGPIEGMVFVKAGCFMMGDNFGDGYGDEKPVHEVCVDDFYIGKYEVTQRQWEDVMGKNPSHFKGCDDCPVEQVSWNDIQEFINKLNNKTGQRYRLPTEAEWEYAARSGGKKEKYSGGDDIDGVAWYDGNSGSKSHQIGQKRPNGLGIYDMSGNVWEGVADWYGGSYYKDSPKNNPQGPSSGSDRVLRGGSWYGIARHERASFRFNFDPDGWNYDGGFRVARTK